MGQHTKLAAWPDAFVHDCTRLASRESPYRHPHSIFGKHDAHFYSLRSLAEDDAHIRTLINLGEGLQRDKDGEPRKVMQAVLDALRFELTLRGARPEAASTPQAM